MTETWSFTLREEYRLKLFEEYGAEVYFWPKRDEVIVTGGSC